MDTHTVSGAGNQFDQAGLTNRQIELSPEFSRSLAVAKYQLSFMIKKLNRVSEEIRMAEEILKNHGFCCEVFHKVSATEFYGDEFAEFSDPADTLGYADFLGWMKDEHGKFRLHLLKGSFHPDFDDENKHPYYGWVDVLQSKKGKPFIECSASDRASNATFIPQFLDSVVFAMKLHNFAGPDLEPGSEFQLREEIAF